MKKLLLISSMFLLVSCAQTSNTQNETIEEVATEVTKTTIATIEENFEDIITKEFNNENEIVKISKTEEVVSSDIQASHTEYKIEPIDSEYLNQIREANDRIYSNQGTDEDKALIKDIRLTVKELATQLDNDLDAIIFNYPDEQGNIMLVAMSQKNNDIIPID